MKNGLRKSDSSIVPEKLPNKVPLGMAEAMEGRGLTKGKPFEQNTLRTQGRESVPSALERIREAVRRNKEFASIILTLWNAYASDLR